jgi:hypothetical protein
MTKVPLKGKYTILSIQMSSILFVPTRQYTVATVLVPIMGYFNMKSFSCHSPDQKARLLVIVLESVKMLQGSWCIAISTMLICLIGQDIHHNLINRCIPTVQMASTHQPSSILLFPRVVSNPCHNI